MREITKKFEKEKTGMKRMSETASAPLPASHFQGTPSTGSRRSRCSRVQLLATPWAVAHQAPLSMGFSRQEHWSGFLFPSPMHESEKKIEVAQSCLTLSDPMDYSIPGSSVHGIFQARVLEWGATAFSIW